MARYLELIFCLASLCTVIAQAQTQDAQPASTSSPIAFVYVVRTDSS